MQYYLIDKNKVRLYFELYLMNDNVESPIFRDYHITLYNVRYSIRESSLDVIDAMPVNENAFAITTKGLIEWKNIVKALYYYEKSKQPGTANYAIRDFNSIAVTDIFCAGFICLGKLPSEDAFRITPVDFKVYNSDENKIYSPDEVKFKIYEDEGSLIILRENQDEKVYYLGPIINDTMYIIHTSTRSTNYIYSKKVIPRGTCFETDYVVNLSGKTPKLITNGPYYELCY